MFFIMDFCFANFPEIKPRHDIKDITDNIKNNTNEKKSLVEKKCSNRKNLENEWVTADGICKQAALNNLTEVQKKKLESELEVLKNKKNVITDNINVGNEKDSFAFKCNNLRTTTLLIREIECKLNTFS